MKLLGLLFSPLVFGIAFLAPLIAQSLVALGVATADINPLWVGIIVGGGLGLAAQIRGSWFWIKL